MGERGTFHMIGNAHIDPVWLWDWREGFQEIKASFRSALDRMKEYPDFVFTCSSAAFYAWVEHNDPAMFEEIRQRVQEGRWALVGGWWVEPDCNIPGGEAFVRQGLYAQRYFQSRFGRVARVGYNPDSFGHAATLPQILLKSGMPYYTFMRPGPHEQNLPGRLFWWGSPDGSRVLTFRIPYEYTTWGKDLEVHVRKCLTEVKPPFDTLMCFYGVGNHGGGPTRENLESIRRLSADPELPELRLSHPEAYFEAVEGTPGIPAWHEELQHHASGCYAAHSGIKQWNRRAENALLLAEKLATLAHVRLGRPYPAQALEHAWKRVLFNQFHDILAGTSLEAAYEDARNELGEALSIASHVANDAAQALSWQVDIPAEEGMKPVVVFNPHPWAVRAEVELEYGGLKEGDALVDERGRQVPLQTVRSGATVSGWRKRLAFVAELPAFGHRLYRVKPAARPKAHPWVGAGENTLENRFYRLTLDPQSGAIASLYDKARDLEVFKGLGAQALVAEDRSDTWSHGVLRFDRFSGAFEAESVRLYEQGPVKAVLRVRSTYGRSVLLQDFTLYHDLPHLEVRVTLDWRERHKALKLAFPANLHFPQAAYEAPYGALTRPTNGEEEPGQGWADLSGVYRPTGAVHGLALLNDAKYSYSAEGHTLYLTVLRSPIYAHHDPYVPDPQQEYSYMDQGLQRFTYWLLPHAGSWEEAGLSRRALELHQRPVALVESYHAGELRPKASFLEVSPASVVPTVLKKAEDSDALVLRLYESTGRAARARVALPLLGRTLEADFGPYEIKTLLIPRGKGEVREVNLLEWEGSS
ncbi:Mannosylglycerate hydrolase [Calidithermus terrae]|uniref:Mannosylglycerate hydrolase n=1 Tax=Calidithermus terrae TaxID=1408545 RepID=A0A399EQ17_9DEIN|nr:alpha-mannosidase [Calidithermus terrae]RIH85129.1 Mannosylglycerate hydrolase [Calidithermus terrae]